MVDHQPGSLEADGSVVGQGLETLPVCMTGVIATPATIVLDADLGLADELQTNTLDHSLLLLTARFPRGGGKHG